MAYVTNEDVKAVRNELKKAFPKIKFSVRKDNHSSVEIAIMKGPKELETLFVGNQYNEKNRYAQINHFHPYMYGEHEGFVKQVSEIAHNAPGRAGGRKYYDNSDAMTDYFDTAFYVRLAIGKWDRPYEVA